jgi:hypothetical protein
MKLVRQLVKRQSAQEGWKHVGDEYAVVTERADLLASRGIVEIIGDITKTEAAELVEQPSTADVARTAATARAPGAAKKKAARKSAKS